MLTSITPGIRRHPDHVQPRVRRRRIALDMDRQPHRPRTRLGGGDQVEVVLDALHRRHEDAEPPVARLDRQGGPHHPARLAKLLLDPLLLQGLVGVEMRHRLRAAAVHRLRRLPGALRRAIAKSGSGPRGTVGSSTLV